MKHKGNGVTKPSGVSFVEYSIPSALLAILTALVYAPSLHYPFQFDDVANITKYFDIRAHSFTSLFFTGTRWISYWVNAVYYKIAKFDPLIYRLGNITFHILSGILLFIFFRYSLANLNVDSFFKRNGLSIAFFTALLFLLHPVQTQTISYVIQGQLEGLATLFIISMILCFTIQAHTRSSITRFISTILLFVVAAFSCGTKEIAIISPFLLLIVDWFFVAQGKWSSFKSRLPLHAAVTLLIVTIYLYLLKPAFFINIFNLQMEVKNNMGNVITPNPTATITPFHFFISQFKVIVHYLWIFIWPFNISVEYDWIMVRSFFALDCIIPLAFLLALAGMVIQVLRKNCANLIGFGALWFAICIAPRSSLIPSAELLVDYKTYMASPGWLFVIACALIFTVQRICAYVKHVPKVLHSSASHCAIIILFALPIGIATITRNTIWRSGTEFWGNIVENAPGKARAYNNYGVELSQSLGKHRESIDFFKKAILLDKNYPEPWNNIAVAYAATNQTDYAIAALQEGIRLNPYYPEAYNNLALFLLQKKDFAAAEKTLKTALQLRPHYGKAYFNLGRVFLEQNKQEEAWECFKNCCTKGDLDIEAGFNIYGKISMALKKYDDAIFAFKKTLERNPHFPEAAFNLGNCYFITEKYSEAATAFETSVRTTPHAMQAWYNLAETYFVMNKFDVALTHFRKIEHIKNDFPRVYLRIAVCLEKLGKGEEARLTLEQCIKTSAHKNDAATTQIRDKAHAILVDMNRKSTPRAAA